LIVSCAVAAVVACGGLVRPDDIVIIADAGARDTGASDAGVTIDGFGILCDGGVTVNPTRECKVSFQRDIYPKMSASGSWGCARDGCHGSNNGVVPIITDEDVNGSGWRLAQYSVNGKSYVNPCSRSPDDSALLGNLSSPATDGMHMPPQALVPTPDELMSLVAPWIACGAPFN
jgi:hypothetical protein